MRGAGNGHRTPGTEGKETRDERVRVAGRWPFYQRTCMWRQMRPSPRCAMRSHAKGRTHLGTLLLLSTDQKRLSEAQYGTIANLRTRR